ncbi:MAG: class I SAM-dependent methyltransferase [Eubacteriales bacterium]
MNLNMRTENDMQRSIYEFNKMSDYYDKYRPDYPIELIKAIVEKANLNNSSKLLEIGSGSGKATIQFADLGCEIVCIEPGVNSVEQGKVKFISNKNISFITSRFEDYNEPPEYFDAIISAQAFHWISQPLGYEKCFRTLKKGGYLAPFWHIDLSRDVDLDRELVAVFNKYDCFVSCMPEADYKKRMDSISEKITSSGLFSEPSIIHFHMDKTYTADEYFGYLLTSHLCEKTDDIKHECFNKIVLIADKYNGIKRRYTYELYLTQKITE